MLLVTAEERRVAVTTTDVAGQYELSSATAGSYRVVAERDGFLPRRYGAREPPDIGTLVTLRPGQTVEAADIALSPSSAISGRVVDEFGEPMPQVFVVAGLRYRRGDDIGRFAAIRIAYTDDLGRYRLWGLPPGKYYLRVEPPRSSEPSSTGYAPIYYPNARALSAARHVDLTTSREKTIETITLPKVRTVRILGTLNAPGRPAGKTVYLATRRTDYELPVAGATPVRDDGSFTSPGLLPGDYTLSAIAESFGAGTWFGWGQTRAAVGDKDLGGVLVAMHPGAALSGRVVSEDGSMPPVETIRLFVDSLDMPYLPAPEASVAKDGTFVVKPLFGNCLLEIGGVPAGWMVKALIVNGRDVLDTPVAFEGGQTIAGARVVLARRVSSVGATVEDHNGRPSPHQRVYIAIYREPSDHGPAEVRPFRRVARSPSTFHALPPGDYFAFANTGAVVVGDFDTEALAVLRATGTRFAVREGETTNITVAAMPRWLGLR